MSILSPLLPTTTLNHHIESKQPRHVVVRHVYEKSMEEFTAEVRALFEQPLDLGRLLQYSGELQSEYTERLQSSNISMLPSYQHTLPTGFEKGDFLALDVGVDGYQPGSAPRSSQLLLRTGGAKPQLDIRGVDSLATVAVVQAGGHDGIAFANVGQHAPQMSSAFRIGHGNLAVLGNAGPVLELDTEAPDSAAGVRTRWKRSMTIWAVAGGLFLLLLIAARIATVRRARRGKAPPP